MPNEVEQTLLSIRRQYAQPILESLLQVLRYMGNSEEMAITLTVRSVLAVVAAKLSPATAELFASDIKIRNAIQLVAMSECFNYYVGRGNSVFLTKASFPTDDDASVNLLRTLAVLPQESQMVIWRDAHLLYYKIPPNSLEARLLAPIQPDPVESNRAAIASLTSDNIRKLRERSLSKMFGVDREQATATQMLAHAMEVCGMILDIEKRVQHVPPAASHFGAVRLETFFEQIARSDLTVVHHYLAELRVHGLEKAKDVAVTNLMETVVKACSETAEQRLKAVKRRLSSKIGELGEHYGAEAGWLFIVDNERGILRAAVGHNSDMPSTRNLELKISEGITGWVARNARSRVVADTTAESDYVSVVAGTRSELTVPITSFDGRVIAVLNYESSEVSQFCEIEGLRLTLAAGALSPDVAILRALEKIDGHFGPGWHFRDNDQWSINPMVSEFCYEVQNTIRLQYGIKTAVIVWDYDEEKHVFFVRGTSGYDYEYMKNNGLSERSFIGSVLQERVAVSLPITEAFDRGYVRKAKAQRMGVRWIAAAPFGLGRAVQSGAKGVVTIYGFRNNEILATEVVEQLANKVSAILEYWEPIRREAVLAYCVRTVSAVAPRGRARREAVRDLIMEVFDGDGCSLFSREDEKALKCVVTTGLTDELGNPKNPEDAVYDLKAPDSGATVWIAHNPGRILRKNDANDPYEITGVSGNKPVSFRNKFRESAARSLMEGRRFLGYGAVIDGKPAHVVRLVRKAAKAPFSAADGNLFAEIVQLTSRALPIGTEVESKGFIFRRFLQNSFEGAIDFENGLVSILESAYVAARVNRASGIVGAEIAFAFAEKGVEWTSLSLMACGGLKCDGGDNPKFSSGAEWIVRGLTIFQNGGGIGVYREGHNTDLLFPFCVPLDFGPAYFCLRCRHGENEELDAKEILKWIEVAYAASWWIGLRARLGLGKISELRKDGPLVFKPFQGGGDLCAKPWEETRADNGELRVTISLGPWLLGTITSSRTASQVFTLLCEFLWQRDPEKGENVEKKQMEDGQIRWYCEEMGDEFREFCSRVR